MLPFFILLSLLLGGLLAAAIYFWLQSREEREILETELTRFERIGNLEEYAGSLNKQIDTAKRLLPSFESIADMERHRLDLHAKIDEASKINNDWGERIRTQEIIYDTLVKKSASVEDQLEMQRFGFYQTRYGFEDSNQYKAEIDKIRKTQKELVRNKTATHCTQEWLVEGNAKKGAKMIAEHSKLMLRAFNGECDAAISNVKYNNVEKMRTRIQRAYEQVNKLGESKSLFIKNQYLNSKLSELHLVHEYRDQLNLEKEEQRRIREQMREEERALREIAKAKRDAEKQETAKTIALEQARLELETAHDAEKTTLSELIRQLEADLEEALRRKERAVARAQLTRSGHVYVISNIGVFGEGVFKIGMTRRLEPFDRIKELGDASVPFPFDVHAMIYTEDAPTLESELHQVFASKRLNLVNLRREFFRVILNEIHAEVMKAYPSANFVRFAEAEQFRKSNAIREKLEEGGELSDLLAQNRLKAIEL